MNIGSVSMVVCTSASHVVIAVYSHAVSIQFSIQFSIQLYSYSSVYSLVYSAPVGIQFSIHDTMTPWQLYTNTMTPLYTKLQLYTKLNTVHETGYCIWNCTTGTELYTGTACMIHRCSASSDVVMQWTLGIQYADHASRWSCTSVTVSIQFYS